MKLSKITIPYRSLSNLAFLGFMMFFAGPSALTGVDLVYILLLLVGALLAGFLILGYQYLYWKNYTIRIDRDGVEIDKGVFTKNHRDIPLRRIQNIDINRNIVQRILGVSEVRLETAGGNEVEASIKYLNLEDAHKLQAEIQELKDRRAERQEKTGREKQGEEKDFELSMKNLAILSATSLNAKSIGGFFLLLSVSGGVISTLLEATAVSASIVLGLIGLASLAFVWTGSFATNFAKFFDFELQLGKNSLDYSRGLFNRASGSIPREKIQSLTIEENVLKRFLGFATLKVETAGYSSQNKLKQSETVIPISESDQVRKFAERIQKHQKPEFYSIDPQAKKRYTRRYIMYSMFLGALFFVINQFVSVPVIYLLPVALLFGSRKAAELKWRNIGYSFGDHHLAVRKGFWSRKTYIVPYFRVQNLMKSQTVFQKRWDQATVTVDTAGSVLTNPRIVDLDVQTAEEVKQEIFSRFKQSLG